MTQYIELAYMLMALATMGLACVTALCAGVYYAAEAILLFKKG